MTLDPSRGVASGPPTREGEFGIQKSLQPHWSHTHLRWIACFKPLRLVTSAVQWRAQIGANAFLTCMILKVQAKGPDRQLNDSSMIGVNGPRMFTKLQIR